MLYNMPSSFIQRQLDSNYMAHIIISVVSLIPIVGWGVSPVLLGISIYYLVNAYSVKNHLMYLQLSNQCEDDETNETQLSHARGLIHIWWWSFGIAVGTTFLLLIVFPLLIITSYIHHIVFLCIYINKRNLLSASRPFSFNDAIRMKHQHHQHFAS